MAAVAVRSLDWPRWRLLGPFRRVLAAGGPAPLADRCRRCRRRCGRRCLGAAPRLPLFSDVRPLCTFSPGGGGGAGEPEEEKKPTTEEEVEVDMGGIGGDDY